mmetsp:Transcript_22983/g.57533  ORF Transcript_22983/g.57533 Transcript_22983/m.57533 type:complete len:197 (-) Transcript_22983:176-766(-)
MKMADVSNEQLTQFLIDEEILFNINGNHFAGDAGRWFQGQVVRRQFTKWKQSSTVKPEYFIYVRHIEKDKPGLTGKVANGTQFEEDFRAPVSTSRRGAKNIRDLIYESMELCDPKHKDKQWCLWDLHDMYPSTDSKLKHVSVSKSKGFYIKQKYSQALIVLYSAITLGTFAAGINQTPIVQPPKPKSYKDSLCQTD